MLGKKHIVQTNFNLFKCFINLFILVLENEKDFSEIVSLKNHSDSTFQALAAVYIYSLTLGICFRSELQDCDVLTSNFRMF